MIPISQALVEVTDRLRLAGIEEPRREARLLLAFALGTDAAGLLTRDDIDPLLYAAPLARRAAREPLAYITGRKEFWGLSFLTSPATLIPRPDTETLIEAVLHMGRTPELILDLGTGTGCLLLACLHEFPKAYGVGIDINPEAAQLARRNAVKLGFSQRSAFLAGHWFNAISDKFDLILSNPPYIEHSDIPTLMPEVSAFEPKSALDGGPDGLAAYREIIGNLPKILAPDGLVVLEIGIGQADAVRKIGYDYGFSVSFYRDISGIERAAMLVFHK